MWVNSGGYLPRRSGSVNIPRYSPPLRRIIVNGMFVQISFVIAYLVMCLPREPGATLHSARRNKDNPWLNYLVPLLVHYSHGCSKRSERHSKPDTSKVQVVFCHQTSGFIADLYPTFDVNLRCNIVVSVSFRHIRQLSNMTRQCLGRALNVRSCDIFRYFLPIC